MQGKVDDSNVGARVVDVTGNYSQDASGTFSQGSDGDMSLESATKLTAKVGGSSIEITDSAITISAGGSVVVIDASGVSVNGSEIKLNC